MRQIRCKDLNIYQLSRQLVKAIKTPKKDIIVGGLEDVISPLSISTDLEPRFKLSPSLIKNVKAKVISCTYFHIRV